MSRRNLMHDLITLRTGSRCGTRSEPTLLTSGKIGGITVTLVCSVASFIRRRATNSDGKRSNAPGQMPHLLKNRVKSPLDQTPPVKRTLRSNDPSRKWSMYSVYCVIDRTWYRSDIVNKT